MLQGTWVTRANTEQLEFVQEVSARAPQRASYRLPPHTIYQPSLLGVSHLTHTNFDVPRIPQHNL